MSAHGLRPRGWARSVTNIVEAGVCGCSRRGRRIRSGRPVPAGRDAQVCQGETTSPRYGRQVHMPVGRWLREHVLDRTGRRGCVGRSTGRLSDRVAEPGCASRAANTRAGADQFAPPIRGLAVYTATSPIDGLGVPGSVQVAVGGCRRGGITVHAEGGVAQRAMSATGAIAFGAVRSRAAISGLRLRTSNSLPRGGSIRPRRRTASRRSPTTRTQNPDRSARCQRSSSGAVNDRPPSLDGDERDRRTAYSAVAGVEDEPGPGDGRPRSRKARRIRRLTAIHSLSLSVDGDVVWLMNVGADQLSAPLLANVPRLTVYRVRRRFPG